MPLADVQKGAQPKPFRMLIHGTEGIGKSTFAAQSPNPIFIQTEDGLGQIDVPRFPLCKSYDEVVSRLTELRDEKHEYSTLALDSVDWLEKLAVKQVMLGYKNKSSIADIDYGKGYAQLIPLFEQIVALLDDLRNTRKMNIILIAHTKTEKVEDPTGSSYDEYAPRLDKRVNGIIREWPDVIGFATHAIARTEEDEGFKKTRTIVKATKEGRILFLESSPAIVAKSRYPLPSQMPLDGKKFFVSLWNIIHGKQ